MTYSGRAEAVPDDDPVRKIAAVLDLSWVSANLRRTIRHSRSAVDRSCADDADEIGSAINGAKQAGAQALNFLATPLFIANRQFVVAQTAEATLPAMYQWPEIADEGGLLAYGTRTSDIYRQAARLVVKVLRGSKPADLPVEQPTKFELVINLKTAKALGIAIPSVLSRHRRRGNRVKLVLQHTSSEVALRAIPPRVRRQLSREDRSRQLMAGMAVDDPLRT